MAEARKTLALLGLTLALVTPAASQGEVAVPFLMISPSQESNGMGETSIAVRRYDPTASILSPAQLGLSALSTNVRTGFYLCPARSLTAFNLPGLTYTAWAASVGVSLNDFIELPFKLGVGLAYHKVDFDLGQFVITGSGGPGETMSFEAYETASGIVVGVGAEYLVRLGIGYTLRSVESHLAPAGTEQEMSAGNATGSASDYSFLLEVPLVSIAEGVTRGTAEIATGLRPILDLSIGIGWNNMGGKLVYIDPAQADPFPRTARAGIAVSGGLQLEEQAWDLLRLAWSREAEDLLVIRHDDGTSDFQTGLGDIQFGKNVLQGEKTSGVEVNSGWQIGVGEILTGRAGTVRGNSPHDTWGYTLHLSGLLKCAAMAAGSDAPDWVLFLRDHVDIQYHSAHYSGRPAESGTTSYSGLMAILRVRSW